MKKFIWMILACSILAIPSYAQETPAADVSVGYSFFRAGGSNGANLNGGSGSFSYNLNNWLGAVADLGVYHGSPSGIGTTAITYVFGPRFTYRHSGRVVPFGQALFGGSHLSASAGGVTVSTSPFAFSFGGGAEIGIGNTGKAALRPEVEYFGLHQNGGTGNSVRVSIGIIYHFGAK